MTLYRTLNPSTGEIAAEFPVETAEGLEDALAQAALGFSRWRTSTFTQRSGLLERAAQRLEARRDECARQMAFEMGKPLKEADTEVGRCANACRYFAEQGERLLMSESRAASDGRARMYYQPLGPILAIMPWNFPFWQLFRCAAPALMAGNPVLLKHAPNTPGCAKLINDIFSEAGAGDGVFQSLFLSDEQAAAVIADRRVAAVSLTGSVRAGKAVARIAGENLKRCVLELGGSDPFIVCADAPLEETVKAAVEFRCLNNGQSCISPKRIFVEEPLYSRFVDAFVEGMKARTVGDPLDTKTRNGPMAREDLRTALLDQVGRSVAAGAKLLTGGTAVEGPGFFVTPGALVGTEKDNPARREELFGPIGVLIPFAGDADLIELANDTDYGLGASVWTGDEERAEKIAEALDAGNVQLNGPTRSDPMLPFGGIKNSGIGRELGREGIREFVNVKTVVSA